jgi:hypothetical protein
VSKAARIEVTDNARAHIVAASGWWTENRPAAPDTFIDELDRIFDLLRVERAHLAR